MRKTVHHNSKIYQNNCKCKIHSISNEQSKGKQPLNTSAGPLISVVVASHREDWIEPLCHNLLNQHGVPVDYEIIVVTDYHNDLLKIKIPEVQWRYLPDKSISLKRNAGIEIAKGEIIAFTDDDCIPAEDWVQQGVEYLLFHQDVDCVEGYTTIEHTEHSGRMLKEYQQLERPGFRTNNIFYRHQVLIEAGSFDIRFSVQREDMDLAFTVLSMGKKIDYCKDIRVTHRFRAKERWDLLKNCWNRRFDPLLFRKHALLYRQFIKTPFPRLLMFLSLLWIIVAGLFLTDKMILLSTGLFLGINLLFVISRIDIKRISVSILLSETISLLAAPFVLTTALLYGSIKFKKLLIL